MSLPPLNAAQAVYLYRGDLTESLADPDPYYDELRAALETLCGHDLACWCPLADAHGQPVPCQPNRPIAGDSVGVEAVKILARAHQSLVGSRGRRAWRWVLRCGPRPRPRPGVP